MANDELMHYGVKGMKWGIRRTPAQLGHKTSSKKTEKGKSFIEKLSGKSTSTKKSSASKTAKEKEKTKKAEEKLKLEQQKAETKKAKQAAKDVKNASKKGRKISEMTDGELEARIARLELEKRYVDLVKQTTPQKKATAMDAVADILGSSAKNIGRQYATYMIGTAVNKLSEKAFDDPRVVNPKKGQKD